MELILYTLRSVAYAIVDPAHLIILVILGIMFYMKNRRVSIMQKMTVGESLNSPLELTLSQLVLGIVAGAIGSIILSSLGIVFNQNSGIELIFMVSLFLVFIKKRFVCFSYSGAILGLISVITNATGTQSYLNINVVSLMTFIGVLHIVEAFLVMVDGNRGAVPVFSTKDGKIVGGFSFNRYWAMPIAIFIAITTQMAGGASSAMVTPAWWPIINKSETLTLLAKTVITCVPLYGMIGYNAVTFTKLKRKKTLHSGMLILIYGITLAIVAQAATFGIIGQLIVIIYAPLAHELMLKIQKKSEDNGKFIYVSDEVGVAVLEVAPSSPAFSAGIRTGDKILEINNKKVLSEVDIFHTVKDSTIDITIKIKKFSGEIIDYVIKPKNKRVGILLVPKMIRKEDALGVENDDFKKILDEMKKKK
ncbi:PDZ domain-containing protein [Clostridium gasigenes]|uniref:PDZ domain-containing protein n=1 Tax=Clostridium gasigenes TaxID=94869 RepID=A0A1H0QQJ9_9CLOT|nr:PDZ domain-containing protein [Clostridium gasigenes]MBB6625141.1 PDZ domain-containing protein [Clostridium gasigenes]MBU3089106.1 PDZ domain-containing protein [Clostridium gasigenes]MBU3133851.1 PDZ domain-containing protein [Clostridium gasigenes]MBU3136937.1 PDZ domain-containing protein [Clostridium gasigenes]NKF06749.1 PDZ domain-containing protein [Clostridium gasigenes]